MSEAMAATSSRLHPFMPAGSCIDGATMPMAEIPRGYVTSGAAPPQAPRTVSDWDQGHHGYLPCPADKSTRLWARALVGLTKRSGAPLMRPGSSLRFGVIPAVNRDDWLHVGMALHATGWPNAFEIWDAWSRTCPEKYNEADQRRTWDGFRGPRAGASITLGTVFHLATEQG